MLAVDARAQENFRFSWSRSLLGSVTFIILGSGIQLLLTFWRIRMASILVLNCRSFNNLSTLIVFVPRLLSSGLCHQQMLLSPAALLTGDTSRLWEPWCCWFWWVPCKQKALPDLSLRGRAANEPSRSCCRHYDNKGWASWLAICL